jgi:nitrate reductase NapAB chaperone NapD
MVECLVEVDERDAYHLVVVIQNNYKAIDDNYPSINQLTNQIFNILLSFSEREIRTWFTYLLQIF